MWPVKPSMEMLLSKPGMEQSNPEDKNCQATRCFHFKTKCAMARPVNLPNLCESESEGTHLICGQ